jgi:hypothetical protein
VSIKVTPRRYGFPAKPVAASYAVHPNYKKGEKAPPLNPRH